MFFLFFIHETNFENDKLCGQMQWSKSMIICKDIYVTLLNVDIVKHNQFFSIFGKTCGIPHVYTTFISSTLNKTIIMIICTHVAANSTISLMSTNPILHFISMDNHIAVCHKYYLVDKITHCNAQAAQH